MTIRLAALTILLVSLWTASSATAEEHYKLSASSIKSFKELQELTADAADRERLAQAILTVAPFRLLLDGASPDTALAIASEDWSLFASALQGLNSHFRAQLRFYCQSEMLRHPGGDDHKFWARLTESF